MKAQVWSFDYAVSVVIFMTIFVVVFFGWYYTNAVSFEQIQLEDIQNKALVLSDILIRIPGIPDNWTAQNVIVIGLARTEKVLDREKVFQLMNLDYQSAKSKLGTGGKELYVQFRYTNGSLISVNGQDAIFGLAPVNSSVISPVERYVLMDGDIVKMQLSLWIGQ